jgi:glycerate 2-kinase
MEEVRIDLDRICRAAIDAVDPLRAVHRHLVREGDTLILKSGVTETAFYDLKKYRRVIVVGAGKATAPMAKAVEEIMRDRPVSGCISVKYGYTTPLSLIETIEAGHPVPDKNSITVAARIRSILKDAGPEDLVISLLSGGGSALLCMPPEGMLLDEKRTVTDMMLRSGAAIEEMNTVRKHLSLIKGGNCARIAAPATVINLMISDVVGDPPDVIASGPFVPDTSTFADAVDKLEAFNLMDKIPKSAREYLMAGTRGEHDENPSSGDAVFKNVNHQIIASNMIALAAAKSAAVELGYNTLILSSSIVGDTAAAAGLHVAVGTEIATTGNPVSAPACILSGGETTVAVKGTGLGGRNMEFVLHGGRLLAGKGGITLASFGTDGTDGPTDAAGAIADGTTVERGERAGMDIREYIGNNDSYHFFKATGDLILTGPTNTNVMDVRIILVR